VVPDVKITVTNTDTQDTRKATTNKEGIYQLLGLPIGNYKVSAEHAGFSKVNSAEQKLLINQSLRIDFKMEVGARVRPSMSVPRLLPSKPSTQLWDSRSPVELSPTCP